LPFGRSRAYVAGDASSQLWSQCEEEVCMGTRPLGKTGEWMPILSLGCRLVVDEEGCSEDQL
jgi:hypothetical protein